MQLNSLQWNYVTSAVLLLVFVIARQLGGCDAKRSRIRSRISNRIDDIGFWDLFKWFNFVRRLKPKKHHDRHQDSGTSASSSKEFYNDADIENTDVWREYLEMYDDMTTPSPTDEIQQLSYQEDNTMPLNEIIYLENARAHGHNDEGNGRSKQFLVNLHDSFEIVPNPTTPSTHATSRASVKGFRLFLAFITELICLLI